MPQLKNTISANTKKLGTVELILIIGLSIMLVLPIFRNAIPFFGWDLILISYAFYLSRMNTAFRKAVVKYLLIIAYIALMYTLLTDAISISQNVSFFGAKRFVSKFSQYLFVFFPLCLFYRVIYGASNKQHRIIIVIISGALLYLSYTTLSGIQEDIMLARSQSFDNEQDNKLAGYYDIYSYSFLSCLSFFLFFVRKKKKILYLILFLFCLYFLYRVQFALSIVTLFVAIAYITVKYTNNVASKVFYLFIIFLALVLLPNIIDWLMPKMDTDLSQVKLNEIKSFFQSGTKNSEDSDLVYRLQLYWLSIKAFLTSPIWGHRMLPFDGHATLLMCLADLGVIGGIPIWYLFIKSSKIVKKNIGGYSQYYDAFFILLILNGLTNPIHNMVSLYVILWFFIPLVIVNFFPTPNPRLT